MQFYYYMVIRVKTKIALSKTNVQGALLAPSPQINKLCTLKL